MLVSNRVEQGVAHTLFRDYMSSYRSLYPWDYSMTNQEVKV